MKKLQTFDSIYFRGNSHFEEDGTQNYLIIKPIYRYFKRFAGIFFWKPKGLSDENITALTTTNYSLNPQLSYPVTKTRIEFKRSCLKQDKIMYDYGKVVNIYIVYEISKNYDINTRKLLIWCSYTN